MTVNEFYDNQPLEEQTEILARFLIDKFGGPWRSMGAIEMAMRLLEHLDPYEVYEAEDGHPAIRPRAAHIGAGIHPVNWDHSMTAEERRALAEELERQIRPLIHKDRSHEGGYDCCGCSTYEMILDHAIAIVLGEEYVGDG